MYVFVMPLNYNMVILVGKLMEFVIKEVLQTIYIYSNVLTSCFYKLENECWWARGGYEIFNRAFRLFSGQLSYFAYYTPVSTALFLSGAWRGVDTSVIQVLWSCVIMHVCLVYLAGVLIMWKWCSSRWNIRGPYDLRSLHSQLNNTSEAKIVW